MNPNKTTPGQAKSKNTTIRTVILLATVAALILTLVLWLWWGSFSAKHSPVKTSLDQETTELQTDVIAVSKSLEANNTEQPDIESKACPLNPLEDVSGSESFSGLRPVVKLEFEDRSSGTMTNTKTNEILLKVTRALESLDYKVGSPVINQTGVTTTLSSSNTSVPERGISVSIISTPGGPVAISVAGSTNSCFDNNN